VTTALAEVPVRSIITGVAVAAGRWSDADFPPRVRALDRIAARTGYSIPTVEYALDRLFFPLDEEAITETIAGELGSLQVLDGFHDHRFASPAGAVCVISSRTTIGVALWPAIFALCAKCDVLVKDREDALIASFFETLAEEREQFARAARAMPWSAGESTAPDLQAFDAVVAFGSDATLREIGSSISPDARYVAYASRASAGYVTQESLQSAEVARAIARGAARDVVLYETQGCLSLHVLFLERAPGCAPDTFARLLDEEIAAATVEFPAGRNDASVIAAQRQLQSLAAFRAASGSGAVYTSNPATHAIVLDPPRSEPPAFLPRALGVITVDGPGEALEYLQAHAIPLEGFAISCARENVVDMAMRAGAVRLARFGELQHPPLNARHGGRPRIADFVKWIENRL
jgi:hypothetical protein